MDRRNDTDEPHFSDSKRENAVGITALEDRIQAQDLYIATLEPLVDAIRRLEADIVQMATHIAGLDAHIAWLTSNREEQVALKDAHIALLTGKLEWQEAHIAWLTSNRAPLQSW